MLFSSPVYVFLFLPLVVAVYFWLSGRDRTALARYWLIAASLFFYAYWNPAYLPLLVSSIVVNFWLGAMLVRSAPPGEHPSRNHRLRKWTLIGGVVFNLSLLGVFKYAGFLVFNLNWVLEARLPDPGLLLPLAISFFTFQQIAYLVDCYRLEAGEYSFPAYTLFVCFFPQLIAGPIVHHREMMPQFASESNRRLNWNNIATGLFVFFMGLFKKVVVADSFAAWANEGFAQEGPLGFFDAWTTCLSYSMQLYYDFSGYTDMAIGAALIFNIRLPINFNSPYKALSIQDFWRRWHITLSRWLRDYLYIPLGGNRKGESRTLVNLMLTFLLGGLWHGAGWTFVAWGALHGGALIVHRVWSRIGFRLPGLLAWFLTFLFVNVAWVFFRATSIENALAILRGMSGLNGFAVPPTVAHYLERITGRPSGSMELTWLGLTTETSVGYIVGFFLIAVLAPNTMQMAGYVSYQGRFPFRPRVATALAMSVVASVAITSMLVSDSVEFLYFNF